MNGLSPFNMRPVSADVVENYLEDEGEVRIPGLDPMDRGRFHQLVRESAKSWLMHAGAGLRPSKGKHHMALQFEGPIGGKTISIFSLRAQHKTGEFCFKGPNPDRRRLGLPEESVKTLDRLRRLYEAYLGAKDGGGEAITVVFDKGRVPDLTPLVEETRRALDGGDSGSAPGGSGAGRDRRGKGGEGEGIVPQGPIILVPTPTPPAALMSADVTSAHVLVEDSQVDNRNSAAGMLFTCPDPKEVATYYGRVTKLRATRVQEYDDGWQVLLGNFQLLFLPEWNRDDKRALGFGSVEKYRGWGAILRLAVSDYDLCLRRIKRLEAEVVREDPTARSILIRDPAGYLCEVCGRAG